ncbi:uncharacterized protein F4812DRAFT_459532 [Daldinia caldariorum]|uniref:uncharacterized protein n=1 Tax=Daldinia caldariorum TaxID=326644 RepID=UPI002007A781|nr:uncharacterized protein F4812DRAFT_459532 [Daldinia caldariorum]KAI1467425.1 hypothetical protein F4812DRAFT_459532 [Daldinia caldariorum]
MSFTPRTPSPKPQRPRTAHYRRHSVESPITVKQCMSGPELASADRRAQLIKQPSPFDSPTFAFQSTSAKEHEFRQFLIRTSNLVPIECPLDRLSSYGSPCPMFPKTLSNSKNTDGEIDEPYEPFHFKNSKRFLAFELYKLSRAEDLHCEPNFLSHGNEIIPQKRSTVMDTDKDGESSGNHWRSWREMVGIVDGDATGEEHVKKRAKLCNPDTATNDGLVASQQLPCLRVHQLCAARYGEDSGSS